MVVQNTFVMGHGAMVRPEMSTYLQLPLPEHAIPGTFVGHSWSGTAHVKLVHSPYKHSAPVWQNVPTAPEMSVDSGFVEKQRLFESPTTPLYESRQLPHVLAIAEHSCRFRLAQF